MNDKDLARLCHDRLEYKDGALYWKVYRAHNAKQGDRAGADHVHGYRIIKINKRAYKEHRIIFLMHYMYLPREIDHINGVKTDNRIENLRPATPAQNQHNRTKYSNNTSGYKGVSFCRHRKNRQWVAVIQTNKKQRTLGYYSTAAEAYAVYCAEAKKEHGEFANVR